MATGITKTYLKTWALQNYYQYKIYEIKTGDNTWVMAEPVNKGATRTANTEQELRAMLEKDALSMLNFYRKVR